MNREDIIRMAREAGGGPTPPDFLIPVFERFAALVASVERERIKQANAPEIERINAHIKELEDAVAAEREACAELCEMLDVESPKGKSWDEGTIDCANAIRARGQA